MFNLKNIYRAVILPYLLGFGLFIYLVLRAFLVAMTDDECITVYYHVSENWWSIVTTSAPNQGWAGNNHVLNTLFMKLEMVIFGKHDWALRLHILGSFVICYYFTLKIIEQITPSPLKQFFYLSIIFLNPFLLDFFAIARGYAISLAAWSYAFYYFLSYSKALNLADLRRVIIGLFLGVWSNFSMLYLVLFFGFMFLHVFYRQKKADFVLKHFVCLVLGYLFIIAVNVVPLYKSIKGSEIYGGATGIFKDIVVGAINGFLHSGKIGRFDQFNENWTRLEVFGIIGLVLWTLIQGFSFWITTDRKNVKAIHYAALFQTVGVALLVKVLFIFAKSPYPMGRTALLFSFPFLIATIAAFDILLARYRKLSYSFVVIIPFLYWHISNCANLFNTFEWWQAGDAKEVVAYMKDYINVNKPQKILKLGAEGYQYFPLEFYTIPQYNNELIVEYLYLTRETTHCDFLFVPTYRAKDVWSSYEPLKVFKRGTLFKKKP
jgi:hypothetical protein